MARLSWQRVVLTLTPLGGGFVRPRQPLATGQALVKSISARAGAPVSLAPLFVWSRPRLTPGRTLELRVDLYGADADQAAAWAEAARGHFEPGGGARNFRLEGLTPPLPQALEPPPPPTGGDPEVCLRFFTPLPFKVARGRAREWIEAPAFLDALRARRARLFGDAPDPPEPPLAVLPFYWGYRESVHRSASQGRQPQYLNGCVGPLYLRARDLEHLAAWWPWLYAAEALGVGWRVSFGLGRCRLEYPAPPFFAADLYNASRIGHAVQRVVEHHDDLRVALGGLVMDGSGEGVPERVAESLRSARAPAPFEAMDIPKEGGGRRRIERPAALDLVILTHLHDLLAPVLDRGFEPESIGFRKGLSRETAVVQVREAVDEGFDAVLESDVAACFESVPLDLLRRRLDEVLPLADRDLRACVERYLAVPCRYRGEVLTRERGLPQGSPLSPLLANLYLDIFDKQVKALPDVRLIRYADDFVILTRGLAAAGDLGGRVAEILGRLGLEMNLDKTAVHRLEDGFVFLGLHLGGGGPVEPLGVRPGPWRKPLYVTQPYCFLGLDGDAVELRREREVLLRVPLMRVGEILLLAPALCSSALLVRCAHAGVPVVLTSGNGRHTATLAADDRDAFETAHRHALAHAALGPEGGAAIARRIVSAKVANTLHLMRTRYRPGLAKTLHALEAIRAGLAEAETLDRIRGLEGNAARLGFAAFGEWLGQEGFVWRGRVRRPADRINSLLNFGYHLSFNRLNVLVRAAGLNPYLGILHSPTARYETLVADLQEVFRAHVDRLVTRLVNLRQIRTEHFHENDAGHWLTPEGKRVFLTGLARELEARPEGTALTPAEAMEWQVGRLRDHLLEGAALRVYRLDAAVPGDGGEDRR